MQYARVIFLTVFVVAAIYLVLYLGATLSEHVPLYVSGPLLLAGVGFMLLREPRR